MFHLLAEYSILAVQADDARGVDDRPARDVVTGQEGDYSREEWSTSRLRKPDVS